MIIEDDRTEEQKHTHPIAWGGTDSFLSGWGRAEGGVSIAMWACRPENEYRVERWVRNRGDIKRVRKTVLHGYRPRGTGHCHIYVVDSAHPALR